jgi:putative methyltransferase
LAADNIHPDSLTSEQASVNLPRYVRINTLKVSVEAVLEQLKQDGFNFIENATIKKQKAFNAAVQNMQKHDFFFDIHVDNLLVFHPQVVDLHKLELVKDLTLVLQDKASCLPAFLLESEPDSQVVDSCKFRILIARIHFV